MADSTTMTIDLHGNNEVEFDVNIMNFDGFDTPKVRLCVGNSMQCESILPAKRVDTEKHRWCVDVTPLKEFACKPTSFRIEVIVDGYFFEAAMGELEYTGKKSVTIEATTIINIPELIVESYEKERKEEVINIKPVEFNSKEIADTISKKVLNSTRNSKAKVAQQQLAEAENKKVNTTAKVKAILALFNK